MMSKTSAGNSRSRYALKVVTIALLGFFLISAEGDSEGFWSRLKKAMSDEEKPLPPVEEVYSEAQRFYSGRETLWGKRVRKTRGEDSRAYQNWPLIRKKNYPRALELFQEVVDNYPFSRYAPVAELRIADCHFHMEDYIEAALLYDLFVKMHPKREEVPYALYHQGMCHYNLMRKPSRDQDETRDTYAIFRELVAGFPEDPNAADAGVKMVECRQRLARHELLVADFYFKRREYWAAAARYRGVWQGYSELEFTDMAMFMEASCYEELGKAARARALYGRLIESFPESNYTSKAKGKKAALAGGTIDQEKRR